MLDISVKAAGVISGVVLSEYGDPLVDVLVTPIVAQGTSQRPTYRSLRGVRTDDRGSFRLFGLPNGTYLLSATPACAASCGERQGQFAPIYYPDATDVANAISSEITESNREIYVQVRLRRMRAFSVAGACVDELGNPLAGLSVTAGAVALSGASVGSAVTRGDGSFVIDGLGDGQYVLKVLPSAKMRESMNGRDQYVEIRGDDIRDVLLRVTR